MNEIKAETGESCCKRNFATLTPAFNAVMNKPIIYFIPNTWVNLFISDVTKNTQDYIRSLCQMTKTFLKNFTLLGQQQTYLVFFCSCERNNLKSNYIGSINPEYYIE